MNGIVIRNGIVLTMNNSHEVIVNGVVVIKGSQIIAVGAEDTIRHYPGFKVIDADGGIIMPGLINTHSHLPMISEALGRMASKTGCLIISFPWKRICSIVN